MELGKCVACGGPAGPGETVCSSCSTRNGSPYGGDQYSIQDIVEQNVTLQKDESIKLAFVGRTRNPRAPPDTASVQLKLYVLVTNDRLIAIEEEGLIFKTQDLFEEVGLEAIRGISVRSRILDSGLRINFNSLGGMGELEIWSIRSADPITLETEGPADLEEMRARMNTLIQQKIRSLEQRAKRDKVQILLDFSFLKEEMAKGGIVLQVVKCPSCGGSIDLPEQGTKMKCGYCGSIVLAQDIFEKIKALIAQA